MMEMKEELNEILNQYPKDSQERQDLLRVQELTTCSLESDATETDSLISQYSFIVPGSDGIDMEKVVKELAGFVKLNMTLR